MEEKEVGGSRRDGDGRREKKRKGKKEVGEGGDERYTKLYKNPKDTKPSSGCLSDLTGASGCCTSTFSL